MPLASHSNEGNLVGEDLVLQLKPLQILQRKRGFQCGCPEIKRNHVACRSRFRKLEPCPTFLGESQVVFPAAFLQRLEALEETSFVFRPLDEATEAFVLN